MKKLIEQSNFSGVSDKLALESYQRRFAAIWDRFEKDIEQCDLAMHVGEFGSTDVMGAVMCSETMRFVQITGLSIARGSKLIDKDRAVASACILQTNIRVLCEEVALDLFKQHKLRKETADAEQEDNVAADGVKEMAAKIIERADNPKPVQVFTGVDMASKAGDASVAVEAEMLPNGKYKINHIDMLVTAKVRCFHPENARKVRPVSDKSLCEQCGAEWPTRQFPPEGFYWPVVAVPSGTVQTNPSGGHSMSGMPALRLPGWHQEQPSPQSAANTPEPPPKRNEHPAVWEAVIEDMRSRNQWGISKYKTPLQPFNGREALVDLYQELMDACAYIKQKIMEGDYFQEQQLEKQATIERLQARIAELESKHAV